MYSDLKAATKAAKQYSGKGKFPCFVIDTQRHNPEFAALYGRYSLLDWVEWSESDYKDCDIVAQF